MNLLVDHGWRYNLGDAAQVEGAVSRLLNLLPDLSISIFFQDSPSWLWHDTRINKQDPYGFQVLFPPVSNFLLKTNADAATSRLVLPFLDAPFKPGSIKIRSGTIVKPAAEFCKPFDALYITGGGFLTDVFQKDLARKCLLMMAFAAQGKPVILTGQQLGPFRSSLNKNALIRALHNVDFVGLREPSFSPRYCLDAGLPPDRFQVMGDDSFPVKPATGRQIEDILYHHGLAAGHFIAINLRMVKHYTGDIEIYVNKLCNLFDRLAEKTDLPLFFVPISLDPLDGELDAAARLARGMDSHIAVLEDTDLSPALLKGILAKAWGAVGISYHFCTFSLSQGVPAVCLFMGDYYNQKSQGLVDFWGDKRLAFSLEGFDVNQALNHIIALFQDEKARVELAARSAEAVEHWELTFERVLPQTLGLQEVGKRQS